LISFFHQVHHLSYERLENVFEQVFGLHLSQGAIANSLKRTAQRLEPEAEAIRQTVQTSPVVGSDETGARVDGQNWWQWVFETSEASYHLIQSRRSAQVIEDVFGDHRPEVWVSDLFSAQRKNPAEEHQVCQAHQLRDLQYAIDADRCAFSYRMQQLLLRAKRLATHRDSLPDDLYQRQVQDIEHTCDMLLQQEVASAAGQKMQRRFLNHRHKLFIFLYRADVPFDNNASERALRNSVVHRKVSGGFRSEWGAEAFATVTTVVETAKRRGQQVLAALQELIGPPLPISVASVPP
jgi:transposase